MSLLKGKLHAGEFVADTAKGIAIDGRKILYDEANNRYCDSSPYYKPEESGGEEENKSEHSDFVQKSLSLLHHSLTQALTHMDSGNEHNSHPEGFTNLDPNNFVSLKRKNEPIEAHPASLSLRRASASTNTNSTAGTQMSTMSKIGLGVMSSLSTFSSHMLQKKRQNRFQNIKIASKSLEFASQS